MTSGRTNITVSSLDPCFSALPLSASSDRGALSLGKKNLMSGEARYVLAAAMNSPRVSSWTAEATFLRGSTGSYTTSGATVAGPFPSIAMAVLSLHFWAPSSTPRKDL